MNTANGFPGNEKIYLDLYFENIIGLPGCMRIYLKINLDFFSKKDDIRSPELKDEPPELIITSYFLILFL